MSRKKAQVNTFIGLGTDPKDYVPRHLSMIAKDQHCQLCGQHIVYSFLLEYKGENREKDLRVGSDCIITYVEAHMPNMMQAMIEKMEKEMAALVDEHKAKVFSENYPEFNKKYYELHNYIINLIRKYNAYEFKSSPKYLPLLEEIKKADQDFRSKKYTTEPIAEEILSWHRKKENNEIEPLFSEHESIKKQKLSLKSQIESETENKDFFQNHYLKYSDLLGWNSRSKDILALSRLEKYAFLEREKSYLRSMKIRKNKLLKNRSVINELKEQASDLFEIAPLSDPDREDLSLRIEKPSIELENAVYVRFNFEEKKRFFEKVEKYSISNLNASFASRNFFTSILEKLESPDLDKSSFYNKNMFYNNIIAKNKECADLLVKLLKNDIYKKLEEIDAFLDSEELASSCFN